ncbi:MAG: HEAT repeat domain-containing protein, partial [Verrucomicrobiota bacterium]
MKRWFYVWVLMPNMVWMCNAGQAPALLRPVLYDLLAKQPYSAAAIHTVESGLASAVDPVACLINFAGDKNPEVRMVATQLLPELRNPDAAKSLWNLLRDDSEAVRIYAVGALGR